MPDQTPLPIDVKAGPTTTEFWQTLLTNLLAAVIALVTLFDSRFDLSGLQALVPAVSVLAAAGATAWYSHSRSTVKAAAHQANAVVLNSAEAADGRGQSGGRRSPGPALAS